MYSLLDSTTNVQEDIPQQNFQPEDLQDVAAGCFLDARDESSTNELDSSSDSVCPLSDAPVDSEDDLLQLDTADSGEQEFSDDFAEVDHDAEIEGHLSGLFLFSYYY